MGNTNKPQHRAGRWGSRAVSFARRYQKHFTQDCRVEKKSSGVNAFGAKGCSGGADE
jgi:hypothetical protein